mmetsp:Transcript_64549/g.127623  ORF Transcript_64549/g.127623 Transcript_64549/m.127623 type:complete len:83 (-) Transcript_64549:29-277(-)
MCCQTRQLMTRSLLQHLPTDAKPVGQLKMLVKVGLHLSIWKGRQQNKPEASETPECPQLSTTSRYMLWSSFCEYWFVSMTFD